MVANRKDNYVLTIRHWVKEVKDMQGKDKVVTAHEKEDKLSDAKCPFCGKYMIVESDNDIEKVFICKNCNSRWGYGKEIRRMYRIRR